MGKYDGIEVYEKVWGDLSSKISIALPQTFRLGYFLEYLRLRQYIYVGSLKSSAPMWPRTGIGLTRASDGRVPA